MKFSFTLKNKEASLEADVEGLVKKGLNINSKIQVEKNTKSSKKRSEKTKSLNKNFFSKYAYDAGYTCCCTYHLCDWLCLGELVEVPV